MSTNIARSDEVVVVPIHSYQHASWGQTVELYARFINLTMRQLRIGAAGFDVWQVKRGEHVIGGGSGLPGVLPPHSVSPPVLVGTIELDRAKFEVANSLVTPRYQATYMEGDQGSSSTCESVTWHIIVPA